ncbi:ring finger protein 10 [Nannochloropsis gaditana]|uniref:Ring finger protein 10 n=1 Tax=Nannochloropsis gaditana TaxID=72520 RepID=W7T3U0_9STRA|nr:ring finger protein 10 [Nannochloropsis gaditana]
MDDVSSAREDKACPSSPSASLGPSSLSGEGLDSQASHFYQLEDGQLAFLHPLTMRCLMAEAGGRHALLPQVVEGTVLEAETLVLTPELRGRYGFLKHLPLYSSVKLVELALPPALLSPPTLELFKPEMKKRAQRRKQRERAEEREAARRAREVEREAVREAGRRSSLTEEEIRRIQAQREKGVDLNGPQPWEAARMVSGGDRWEEAGEGEDGGKEGEKEGGVLSGSPSEERRALTSSFAEVIRKKGGAATTMLREEMFPALGGGGGGSPAPMSSSPPGRKSDPPPLSGAVPANGGTGGASGTGGSGGRDCSSPPSLRASAPPLGRVPEPGSGGEGGRGVWTGRTPFSVTSGTSSSLPERSEAGGMWQAGQASPGASIPPTASDGKEPPRPGKQPLQPHQQQKKKGKGGGKGIPIFSTGSQRSYG